MSKQNKQPLLQRPAVVGVLASLLSIIVGLVLGFVLLVLLNPGAAVGGMRAMLATGFSSMDKLGKVLYQAAPLMMCGLSVGFAFKTGLFNIGASGQCTMGAFFSLLCAIQFQMPWYVCLLAGAVGGAIWGVFPGLFKAYFNVNEVITAIMFNWIGMYLVNLLLANMPNMLASGWGASNSDRTAALNVANPGAILPRGPFAALFGNSSWINISIIITIIFAILVWVILQKTTFGYELKACGLSRDAAQYAGINSKRNIVLSMVISGALSGIGGAIYYLAGTGQYVLEKSILGMGFNGIPVALLASSNPIGTIFASLFISYIQVGGAAMQPAYSSETIDIVIAVIIYLAAFALLMRGSHEVNNGALTQGEIIALINYMNQILVSLLRLADLVISVTRALASGMRVNEILNTHTTMPDPAAAELDAEPAAPAVAFDDVTFTYNGAGAPSLTNVSFTAKPGETIGVIGGTGSGKSTLIDLVCRFYDATTGTVSLFGHNVKEYGFTQLRRMVGIVPQQAVLFTGTIRDNMRWAAPDATDEEIWQALEIAQAADFVRTKPGMLDAPVETAGRNFSGGQRQRLTIARALVPKPKVLILDDSASALDFATDAALRKAIKEKTEGMTVFIVSQRAAGVQHADHILVLDDGVLTGDATHSHLLKTCEVYKEICLSQLSKEEVEKTL